MEDCESKQYIATYFARSVAVVEEVGQFKSISNSPVLLNEQEMELLKKQT